MDRSPRWNRARELLAIVTGSVPKPPRPEAVVAATPEPTTPAGSRARPGMRVALGLTAVMLGYHAGLWAWTAYKRGIPALELLDRWDSGLYSTIVSRGYEWPLWAFLPLYPGTVWSVRALLGGALPPQVVGCAVSTLLLLGFAAWAGRFAEREQGAGSPLTPGTVWGWFFLLFSPASFALHSHHTEALFLLLSFGALACAWDGRVGWAAVLAGLGVWTRNQGVFLSITAALVLAARESTWRGRLTRFFTVGAVGLAFYAGLLAFEWRMAGDPVIHLRAQGRWNHVESIGAAVQVLWRGNAWGQPAGSQWQRDVFAVLLLAASVALLRRSRALGIYGLLSLVVMLPQGDLGNAFRFGAVLFPQLFLIGDFVARRPAWVRYPAAALFLLLNHQVTHGFAIGNWVY